VRGRRRSSEWDGEPGPGHWKGQARKWLRSEGCWAMILESCAPLGLAERARNAVGLLVIGRRVLIACLPVLIERKQ
jgi:hypothetical protein